MSSSMPRSTSVLWYWLPPVICAACMWTLSTDSFSAGHTGGIIIPILHHLFPFAGADTLEDIHHAIRKSAHVTEYFILSVLLFRAVRGARPGWTLKWALLALALTAGYGASDETHQIFVPSRGASVVDVMIDTSGGALAQTAIWLWLRRRQPAQPAAVTPRPS
jgi:VanZ family protein